MIAPSLPAARGEPPARLPRALASLALLAAACGGTTRTSDAFAISSDVPSSGDGLRSALFQSVDATLAPGHTLQLLENGAVFDAIITDITHAQHSVDVAMYIWEQGTASRRISTALVAATRRGVACHLVIDSFGSGKFATDLAPGLIAAGCQVQIFRPFPAHSALRRNHRKLVIVDGLVAYTGGVCVRDEWLGDGVHDGGWRDTNVRVTGPAAAAAHQAFAENWQEAGGPLLPPDAFPVQPTDGPATAAFVSSTASPVITRAARLTMLMVAAAHRRLWITNAYFVPSADVVELLKRKARSGVDVRVLVPDEHDDSKVALVGQRRLYPQLAAAGIRVWEYQPSMIHAKSMVVDDRLSLIGSINLDPLSLNTLDEGALVVDDAAFTTQLAAAFERDCTHAKLEAAPAAPAAKMPR